MEGGKLYSFKIKNRKREKQGIFISEGEDWIFLRCLFTDYITDGYILLNKQYITSISRNEEDVFVEDVLKINNKLGIKEDIHPPLSTNCLLEWLHENQIVFQIDNKDESMCWIGKILDATEKSIFLTILTPRGVWKSSYYTFRKNNIRIISFKTDYINSLVKYAESSIS